MVYIILLWKRKHSCSIFMQCSVSIFGKALPIVTKCSDLDVARVLKPLKYVLTWIVCTDNLIQVPGETQQMVILSSMYDHYICFLRFDIK